MLVRDVMLKDFVSAKNDASIRECIVAMFEKHVGSIIITKLDQCVGIFTERDVIRVNAQNISLDKPVDEAMTKNVFTVSDNAPFEEARYIVRSRRVRHLPVINSEGKVVGILSIRHLFNLLFEM